MSIPVSRFRAPCILGGDLLRPFRSGGGSLSGPRSRRAPRLPLLGGRAAWLLGVEVLECWVVPILKWSPVSGGTDFSVPPDRGVLAFILSLYFASAVRCVGVDGSADLSALTDDGTTESCKR